MIAVRAEMYDPTTFLCRNGDGRPTCGDKGGPYRYLCAECKQADREKRSAERIGRPRVPRISDADQGTFEAKAQALVSAGRMLDARIAEYRKASIAKRDAASLVAEASDHWTKTAHRLANMVREVAAA